MRPPHLRTGRPLAQATLPTPRLRTPLALLRLCARWLSTPSLPPLLTRWPRALPSLYSYVRLRPARGGAPSTPSLLTHPLHHPPGPETASAPTSPTPLTPRKPATAQTLRPGRGDGAVLTLSPWPSSSSQGWEKSLETQGECQRINSWWQDLNPKYRWQWVMGTTIRPLAFPSTLPMSSSVL